MLAAAEENPIKTKSLRLGFLLVLLIPTAACAAQVPTRISSSGVPTFGGLLTAAPALSPKSQAGNATVGLIRSSPVPICQASSACAAADAEQIPLDCVKKVPYTNVLVSPGTSFEVLDKSGAFTCIDSGVLLNGKDVITCHGTQLYSFQLRLTNPSCPIATLPTDTGQCDQGYGYDSARMCCAPVNDGPAGSTTVLVNLGACPVPGP